MAVERRFGWRRDVLDSRDHLFAPRAVALPERVDLSRDCPPVYDQGQLGSCTANAICGAFGYDLRRMKLRLFDPSRLFLYFNERAAEGTVNEDAGATLRTGMKVLAAQGVCSEALWPYLPARFARKPPASVYTRALRHRGLAYRRVIQDLDQLRAALAEGFPVVFGIQVYNSFMSAAVARSGVADMPRVGESLLGGHAIMMIGYDNATRRFSCQNSWGASWGMKGRFTLPFEYATNPDLAGDFWTLTQIV